jgi:glycosyltransferase involved in cell wall biosynthesis
MTRMGKSLVIYLPQMANGSIETGLLHMAPHFARYGYDVTFLVHEAKIKTNGFRLISFNRKRSLTCLLPLMRFLRQEKPDILLSNLSHNNIITIWAKLLTRSATKIIAVHHNALSAESLHKDNWQYKILPLITRLFLKKADAVIGVSQGVADDLIRTAKLNAARVHTIYNPIIDNDFYQRMAEPVTHPWLKDKTIHVILGVGRLVKQKDFATLISAFALALRQRDMRLIICGEGPLLYQLQAQAVALGIADKIDFAGYKTNILPFMREASVMVLSTLNEGFGNVLAEALACGTPVISADCPHGPSEILDRGHYGKLVPVGEPQTMANAIVETLTNPPSPEALQKRGQEFSVQRAADDYLKLFDQLYHTA